MAFFVVCSQLQKTWPQIVYRFFRVNGLRLGENATENEIKVKKIFKYLNRINLLPKVVM